MYPFPLGSPRAGIRIFWRDDHVRAYRLREVAKRATALDAVRRQLRGTMRIDFPEQSFRSKGGYDSGSL
ncbi:MAG TPA: hypothetical protein VIP11_14905 [Gemmatimonadaceae bacterium]